jgi:hypothetical protein
MATSHHKRRHPHKKPSKKKFLKRMKLIKANLEVLKQLDEGSKTLQGD